MRIGELAQRTGASARSLRYYEQLGLITADRTDNGYRDYDERNVLVVDNIRRLLAAGLNTAEIKRVGDCLYSVDLRNAPVCEEILQLYEQRIESVDANLEALHDTRERLHAELSTLRERAGTADGESS